MKINVEEYYNRYAPMVLRRCRQLLRNEQEAMDALQEVFLRVLKYKDRMADNYPSSLLFRISTNVCLNLIREKRVNQINNSEDILTRITYFDENEKRFILRNLLDKFFRKEKPSTKEIAVLHFIDEMTLKEVSQEVGLSLSGVRKVIKKLRQQIKIKKVIYDEE
jgi:RNA polymerase sigma-70 factor (ECF subfamily)